MHYVVDHENNYKILLNEEDWIVVPEFSSIIKDKKLGWNFFYYLILFESNDPFGNLREKERDEKVSSLIKISPYRPNEIRDTRGFYTDAKCIQAKKMFRLLCPDPIRDTYQRYLKTLSGFNEQLDNIDSDEDMSPVDKISSQMIIIKSIADLNKIIKSHEDEMNKFTRANSNVIGLGKMIKIIQG